MRAAFYSTLFLVAAASGYATEIAVPVSYPAERYASMREKSPFALATPAAAPAAPKQAPFTQNLVLGGLGVVLDQGEEKIWASIKHRDKTEQFDLYGNEPNSDGISIASVDKSAVSAKTKVMLKKGDEFGTVEYDHGIRIGCRRGTRSSRRAFSAADGCARRRHAAASRLGE